MSRKDNYRNRIGILSTQEYDEFYGIPKFTLEEKEYYFYVEEKVLSSLEKIPIATKTLFILELGYFRASKLFFSFQINECIEDINFILNKYYPSNKYEDLINQTRRNTKAKLRERILQITGHISINNIHEKEINNRVQEIVSIDTNPRYVFYELIRYFERKKMEFPSYSKMQKIISKNLNNFESDLNSRFDKLLDKELRNELDVLLQKEKGKSLLALIRSPAKGFAYGEVQEELSKMKDTYELFLQSKKKLAELKQKEGELMRLYDLRDSVAKQSFETRMIYKEDTKEQIEQKRTEFEKKKIERIAQVTKDIQKAKEVIIEGKNIINKKNVELGIDKRLIEIKYLRVELSRLMKMTKNRIYDEDIDLDRWDKLGIPDRIKELERAKSKIDAEIQSANWSTVL